uniref:protein-serine/threonine phosphatase n=1 Tax=Aegilops tauschii subsp. strangulata TaxID=200361 RepID=A0A453HH08_AEGTS
MLSSLQAFYGVYDGHGGRAAVDFVSDHLGKNVVAAVLATTTEEALEAEPSSNLILCLSLVNAGPQRWLMCRNGAGQGRRHLRGEPRRLPRRHVPRRRGDCRDLRPHRREGGREVPHRELGWLRELRQQRRVEGAGLPGRVAGVRRRRPQAVGDLRARDPEASPHRRLRVPRPRLRRPLEQGVQPGGRGRRLEEQRRS